MLRAPRTRWLVGLALAATAGGAATAAELRPAGDDDIRTTAAAEVRPRAGNSERGIVVLRLREPGTDKMSLAFRGLVSGDDYGVYLVEASCGAIGPNLDGTHDSLLLGNIVYDLQAQQILMGAHPEVDIVLRRPTSGAAKQRNSVVLVREDAVLACGRVGLTEAVVFY